MLIHQLSFFYLKKPDNHCLFRNKRIVNKVNSNKRFFNLILFSPQWIIFPKNILTQSPQSTVPSIHLPMINLQKQNPKNEFAKIITCFLTKASLWRGLECRGTKITFAGILWHHRPRESPQKCSSIIPRELFEYKVEHWEEFAHSALVKKMQTLQVDSWRD